MISNKAAILSAIDWDFEEFEVPKWGTIRIRALSAAERLQLVRDFGNGDLDSEQAFAFFARLVGMSLVDEEGKQLFDPGNTADMDDLLSRNWNRLQMVAERILLFNGMGSESAQELEKN